MATHYIHSVSTEWPTHQCHVGVIGVRKQRLVDSHVLFFTLQTSQTDHKLEGPMIHVQHSHRRRSIHLPGESTEATQ